MEVGQKPFSRKKPDQLVYLELGSGNGGMLLSVSEDGFRFRAVSPLRPQGLMPFAFSFDGNRRLQGIGEVEWLEDDGKSGGMRFVEVSSDFRSALDQWLALESSRARSSREVTPAAAAPFDTMQKIREELRRGYSQPPARKDSQEAPAESPASTREIAYKKSLRESQPQSSNSSRERSEPTHPRANAGAADQALNQTPTEPRKEHPVVRNASLAPSIEPPHSGENRPRPDRATVDVEPSHASEQRSQSFYPAPFTRPAESESAPRAQKLGSAFLTKPAPLSEPVSEPAEAAAAASTFSPRQASPRGPAPSLSREQVHSSAQSVRRPVRPEPRSAHSERPYIPPPIDESFEAAWERAKLTAPPESPHLSRAAAGSIIGIALAVILGALAFNFRRDIGTLVINLGESISGENHAAAPAPSAVRSDNKPDSQPAASGSGSETSSSNKADIPAGANPKPTESSSRPGNSVESGTSAGASHDSGSGTPRDTSRGPNVTQRSSIATPPSVTGNRAPADTAAATPPVSPASSENPNGLAIGIEPGSGQEEFNAAREMLRGDHRRRDLSRAVDLLWAGVRKGYVPAEVTLADLYRRGDGVERNCDQAQVLLVAASKKGSLEARQMLERMAEDGCAQ